MKKTQKRNRLMSVFKKYIRLGLYREKLDVFSVCSRIRGSCRTLEEAKDVFAVWETCRILRLCGRTESLVLFERIYLDGSVRGQNDISMRAVRYAHKHNLDERTVWRRLAYVEGQYEIIRKSLDR
ncbi:MAG: hypothetical protein J6B72_01510 [Clostridia bacterium]|nr:hypothetical protein [Clostridia bacterium]